MDGALKMAKTKLEYLEELKVHPMYKKLWDKLKPIEKSFVVDALVEMESLDNNKFYFKMNRMFITQQVEILNGSRYEKDLIAPTQKVGDTKKVKHRFGSIMDLLGTCSQKQNSDLKKEGKGV